MLDRITSAWKAIVAFLVPEIALVITALNSPEVQAALPADWSKWIVVSAIPVLTSVGAWIVRNQYTVEEAAELLRRAQARAVGEKPV
jgi:hypothetical protein